MNFLLKFLSRIFFSFRFSITNNIDILVNGPSLDKHMRNFKKKNEILVVNQFVRHSEFSNLKPEYYLIQDPYFWRNDIFEHWRQKRDLTLELLEERVKWKMILFLPLSAKNRFHINNSNINLVFFNDTNRSFRYWNRGYYSSLYRLLLDRNMVSPVPSNVLVTGLYLLILMRVPVIRVFGADMSFFKALEVSNTNQIGIFEDHFYGKEFFEVFKSKSSKIPTTISDQLYKWASIFQEFQKLSHYANKAQVKIVNKTPNSYIDAFDRE